MERYNKPTISVTELTTIEELQGLRKEWELLHARDLNATVFQHPDWLIAWWKHLGKGRLLTLAFRSTEERAGCNGNLIGLAPLLVGYDGSDPGESDWPINGNPRVMFLGTGISDYLDLLVEPGFETAVADMLLLHLLELADTFQHCDLQQLRERSPLLLANDMEAWESRIDDGEFSAVLTLPDKSRDLAEFVPPDQIQKLRYYQRRFSSLRAEPISTATQENFQEVFQGLLRLHAARWAMKGRPGVLAGPSIENFHREAAWSLLLRGILRLYYVRLSGKIVAVLYAFEGAPRACYYYLSGFDPEYARLNLGALLVGHAIEQAIRRGAVEFDFLRGQESYKYKWGAQTRRIYNRRLEPVGQNLHFKSAPRAANYSTS